MPAYDEILDFVTSAPKLEQIIAYEHSNETIERVEYLKQAEEQGALTEDEQDELQEFRRASDFMEQLKLRARRRLAET